MSIPEDRQRIYDHLHIRLFEAQRTAIGVSWNSQNVQSTFWRFYRNDRAGACLELGSGDYPLNAERLYFVPAGVRFNCRNTHEVDHLYVHFDVIGLPGVAMRELFAHPVCLPPTLDLESAVAALSQELEAGTRIDFARQCHIKAILYAGLGTYLRSLPSERMERCERLAAALQPVLPAIRQIEDYLGDPLSNRQLAASCSLSENQFIRRFRECVGQTPAQYIQERRVTMAAQRLLFTDLSIEQIADETGFGNRFYFSRVFMRHTGVSPAAYRRSSRV